MTTLPLHGIKVLDATDGLAESAGRLLADLGATVIRIEAPGGSRSRSLHPLIDGVSIPYVLRNSNKQITHVDTITEHGQRDIEALASAADIYLVSSRDRATAFPEVDTAQRFAAAHPHLVAVAISGFGNTGPYRDYVYTESVAAALSGLLSRSGQPGRRPLLPPPDLIEETVGVHAAWSALLAFYHRIRTGKGQYVDLSAHDALLHGFDPGFGVQGSAAAGRAEDFPRDRPDAANYYPIFACRDGHVRLCILAPRQWRALFDWLGRPAEFADRMFDSIAARFAAASRLHPLIQSLFQDATAEELVTEGTARGIPISALMDPREVLNVEHFAASGAVVDAQIAPGVALTIPAGMLSVNGLRAGFRHRPDALAGDPHEAVSNGSADPWPEVDSEIPPSVMPFDGLRVLDLGGVVFGAELSRQFGDHGADVIKIENSQFPDGLRQSKRGTALAASVAWGHRNKRSLGLNLRTESGRKLFLQLVSESDIVMSNFKSGTMEALRLDEATLRAANPAIIISESSAFGSVGPWSTRLGYGPLVRAATGVSDLWRYDGATEMACDAATVYPDHIAGQVAATGLLSALIARTRSRQGSTITVAQADVALTQLAVPLIEAANTPADTATGREYSDHYAPSGVFGCEGSDEWCVIDVDTESAWQRLCTALGLTHLIDDRRFADAPARARHRGDLEAILTQWLSELTPREAMQRLQAAGVACAAMLRLPDLLTDPHLVARETFRPMAHPLLPVELPTATRVAVFSAIPEAPLRPASLPGQDTEAICRELLHLSDDRIAGLIAEDVIEVVVKGASGAR